MILYSLLITISLVLFIYFFKNTNTKKSHIFFYILCLVFTVISAIRYNVGTDYINPYANVLLWLKNGAIYNYELLFLWLNKIIIFFNVNVVTLMMICSAITIPLFFNFIKNNVSEKYWFYSVFLFIASTIYFATMNVVRQYLAISILLFGYEFIKEKKYFRYAICCLVAINIHTSSLIAILVSVLYILIRNKKYDKLMFIVYLSTIIFMFIDIRNFVKILEPIIPNRYVSYLNSHFFMDRNISAIFKTIIPNIIFLIMYFKQENIRKSNKMFNYLIFMWFTYVCISNCFYGINVFIRLGWYFEYYLLLIISMLLEYFEKNDFEIMNYKIKNFSKLMFFIITVYFIFLVIYSIYLKGGHGVLPYQTFFFKI